jgi:subtilisin family serine protease
LAVLRAAACWQLAGRHRVATGRAVTVAVIDSGVDAHHPDLEGQVVAARDFVGSGAPPPELHGTAVAGIIAARADNGLGIAGVAPAARLMALRACWQRSDASTMCSTLTLAQALQFAIGHGADVINLSLSGPPDRLLDELLAAALARGEVIVSAADRSAPDGGFPASRPGVIAVVDDLPDPAPPGAMKAPGRDVPTTEPGGRWALVSGASFASAHVAGLAALLRELRPPPPPALQLVRGAGDRVDACATLARAQGRCVCTCPPVTARGPAMAQ